MSKFAACWVVFFALACAGCLATAQERAAGETPRHQREGRVLDAAGQPVPAVRVQVVSVAACADADPADVVSAVSDAEGRFRVQLQPNRRHRAWAVAPDGVVSQWVPIGDGPIDVRLQANDVVPPKQFVVDGAEAWRAHGPLQVEVAVLDGEPLTVRGTLDANGAIELPPLPDVHCHVRVFAGGHLVGATDMLQSVRSPHRLGAPQRWLARVVDDNRQPIAGAILHRLRTPSMAATQGFTPMRHRVAATGADGTAELLFESGDALFVAHAPGFAETLSGLLWSGPLVDGKRVEDAALLAGVLPFTLRAKPERCVAVPLPEARAPREVLVFRNATWASSDHVLHGAADAIHLPIVDGAIRIPAHSDTWEQAATAIAIPDCLAPMAADDPFRAVARATTMMLPPSALDAPQGLDLRTIVPVRVQVLDPTRRPVSNVQVLCVADAAGLRLDPLDGAMRGLTDAEGRVVLPALPGKWHLVVMAERAWVLVPLEVRSGLAVQTLLLRPFDCMRVRVVDPTGRPLPGVTIASRVSGGSSRSPLLANIALQSLKFADVVTDAAGHADLWFVAAPGIGVRFRASRDKLWTLGKVVAGDERVDIVLQ